MKNLLPPHVVSNNISKHPVLQWIEECTAPKFIMAKHLAIKHIRLDAPPLKNARLNDFIEPIFNSYNSFIPEMKVELEGDLQTTFGSFTRNSAIEKDKEFNQNKEILTEKIDLLKLKIPTEHSNAPLYLFITGIITILFIYSGEINYLASALQIIASSYLSSLILAIGISTSKVIISHLAPSLINKISNKLLRISAQIIVSTLILTSFWLLGSLRSTYSTITLHNETNPISFLFINCVLFFGMYLTAIKLILPNYEGVKKIFTILRAKKELLNLINEDKKIDQAIENNKLVMKVELTARLQKMHLAEACKSLLIRLYHQAVSEYCSTNFIKRGVRSSCLSDTPKPLDFSSFNIIQNTHENN